MEFAEFVDHLDAAIRRTAAVDGRDDGEGTARWRAHARGADVVAVAPRNVSVTLTGAGEPPDTTWYPVDAALVAVVSQRIARHLAEA